MLDLFKVLGVNTPPAAQIKVNENNCVHLELLANFEATSVQKG